MAELREKPFTPHTLAERWECSDQHIRDLVRDNKINCFWLGSLIRIPAQEVARIEALEWNSSNIEESGAPSGMKTERRNDPPYVPMIGA